MNFKANESEQKLSGSYYTPEWLAAFITDWVLDNKAVSILEPSCGDGIFFKTINQQHKKADGLRVYGFDTNSDAVRRSEERFTNKKISAAIKHKDFLEWAIENLEADRTSLFDAVVGNPPFIRYQYLDKKQQELAQRIFSLLGMKFTKHTNAWIPFVVASVEFLESGGLIGMVVPSEIIHVLYAKGLREYLFQKCKKILLIDPEDLWFADTLQGAMLLMAQKKESEKDKCGFSIIRTNGRSFAADDPTTFFKTADYVRSDLLKQEKWTYALLSPDELEAYRRVQQSKSVHRFDQIASVDVGIVTGANKFFLVTDEVVQKYNLQAISRPMFGRSGHCPGVVFDDEQMEANKRRGLPTNFLYFEHEDDNQKRKGYLDIGVSQGIPNRFKCRTRSPWYKVPSVFPSPVNMPKRSNGMPRLILNKIDALRTDTAYRIKPNEAFNPEMLVLLLFSDNFRL